MATWLITTWHTRHGQNFAGGWAEPPKPAPPSSGPSPSRARSRSGGFSSDGCANWAKAGEPLLARRDVSTWQFDNSFRQADPMSISGPGERLSGVKGLPLPFGRRPVEDESGTRVPGVSAVDGEPR